jgi:hypothetical protein
MTDVGDAWAAAPTAVTSSRVVDRELASLTVSTTVNVPATSATKVGAADVGFVSVAVLPPAATRGSTKA